ncbi:MAG: helix-turn-helix protein [Ferruginibacter sp.]|uniref:AraC family transcriptional regulator n=1 Tax=Ferruginibacter sp. TaxID=1940288 RepID=UPI00265B5D8C|nr:AraC family transcriptional regulator [Ferruginibacter sp.]MDB5278311.1 helix-turn-helix protein [Ferruginibacter sp.]
MRAFKSEISNALDRQIAIMERKFPYFDSKFHYHPELELIYIKNGKGKRIIGDKLDTFYSGDIFFIGSDLPHEIINDEEFSKHSTEGLSHAVVAYFNKDVFSNGFYNLRECSKINTLIKKASRGIKVMGKTNKFVAKKINALLNKKDFERIIGLIEILHILSMSDELDYFVCEGYDSKLSDNTADRLTKVFNYVSANFSEDITLEAIAKVANLTPPAFCRMFKQKTKLCFFSYLNEIRISNACKILTESSYNVSEVAFNCGYRTLSNFNKFFKKSTGLSPKAYREKALA